MQNVKIGKYLSDEGDDISDVEKVLRSFGIALREDNDTFRDMSDVLKDTMTIWNQLGKEGKTVEQGMIAVAFAGVRQANVFTDLLNNQDKYNEALKVEADALGTTQERYKIYTDNFEAAANRFTATWEEMWSKTASDDLLITITNIGTAILQVISDIGGLVPVIQTIVALIIAIKAQSIIGGISTATAFIMGLEQSLLSLIVPMNMVVAGEGAITVGAAGMTASLAMATAGISLLAGVLVVMAAKIAKAQGSMQSLYDTFEENKTKITDEEDSIDTLISRYEILAKKKDKTNEDIVELLDIQTALNDKYDASSNGITAYTAAIEGNTKAIEENIRLAKEQSLLKANIFVEQNKAAYEKAKSYLSGENEVKFGNRTIYTGTPEESLRFLDKQIEATGDFTGEIRRMRDELAKEIDASKSIISETQHYINVIEVAKNANDDLADSSENVADAIKTTKETIEDSTKAITDLADMSSNIQSLVKDYDDLNGATMAQVEQLREMFPDDYMNALTFEGDKIKINTDALKELEISRANEAIMAEMASYQIIRSDIERVESAITAAESIIRANNRVIENYQNMSESAIESAQNAILAANAQLTALSADLSESKDALKASKDRLKVANAYANQIRNTGYATKAASGATNELSDSQEAYNDLLSMTVKMLKQNAEDQKDALDDELGGYKKIIDAQKKLLKLKKEQDDYNKDLADANKELSDIDNELLQIQFDNSEEAKKRRLELESEKADAIEDIDELQADRSYDIQVDALDAEYDRYKEYIDAKLSELDNYLKNSGELNQEAINLLSSRTDAFYQSLLDWNRKFGTGVDTDVIAKWQQAISTVQQYSSAVGSAGTGVEITTTVKSSRQLFNEEEEESWNAWLKYKEAHGYHTGGIVEGIPTSKSGEVYAKLMEGEVVSSDSQMKSFINQTLPSLVANVGGSTGIGDISMIFNVAGSVDKSVAQDIKNMVAKTLKDTLNSRGFVPNARLHSI
jgi:hypothetical protein